MLDKIKSYSIWDAHGHMGCYKLFNNPGSDAASILKIMDLCGIERVCVSHLAALEADVTFGNDMVAQAIVQSEGRIMGYAAVNPFEKELVIPELTRCFDRLNFSAIKLHASLIDCPADSQLYEPVYAFAHKRRLAVMAHNFPDINKMEKICDKYCDAFFIQAHYGSAWDGASEPECFTLAKNAPNFYVDCAGSKVLTGVIEKTVDAIGPEKLIFGTDFTFLDPRHQLGYVVFSKINEEHKRMILRENFKRILSFKKAGA